jgi:hypothetical protein
VKEKSTSLKKILNEHYIVAIKEHIRVFLLGLACKKKLRCAQQEKAHKHVWRILLQRQMSKISPYLGLKRANFKKLLDTFYPRMNRPENHLMLLSL